MEQGWIDGAAHQVASAPGVTLHRNLP